MKIMVTKSLGKVALPLLVKYLGNSINSRTSDVVMLPEVQEVQEAKTEETIASSDDRRLKIIHDAIGKEMVAGDKFVRFWRPAFGYSVAVSWLMNMATICYIVIRDGENASGTISALTDTTSLWGIALGVLGVSVVKNEQDKKRTIK